MRFPAHDPVMRLAHQRIIRASVELERQLNGRIGCGAALEILGRLRERAAESLGALAFCNFDDPADLIKAKTLQNEVKRYDEWVGWLREIVNEGKAFDRELGEQEREEMLDVLMQTEEGRAEAEALGLIESTRE